MRFLSCAAALMALAAGGASAQTVVSSNVTTNTTWSGEVILTTPIFVNNGAELTIEPGTIVRGQPRTGVQISGDATTAPGALIVTREGTIQANGNPSNPIIFTTAAVDNDEDGVADDSTPGDPFVDTWTLGDTFLDSTPTTAPLSPLNADGGANVALWGGLVILGNAPTNLADTGNGIGQDTVEGLTVPGFPVADAIYGSDPASGLEADSSGSLQYVSVRHAGDEIGSGNELNGVTLAGVGSGTTFSFIEVYCNQDDGIEWFGGTVNGDHLSVAFAGDDQFDLDQGYTGTNQFALSILPFFNQLVGGLEENYGASSGDKGAEFDGDDSAVNTDGSGQPTPFSNADFFNFTSAGSDMAQTFNGHTNNNDGWEVRNGFAGDAFNGVIYNTGSRQGIDVAGGGGAFGFDSVSNAAAGLITFTAVVCDDVDDFPSAPSGEDDAINVFGSNNIGCNGVNDAGFGLVDEDTSFDPTGVNGKLNMSLGTFDLRPISTPTMLNGTVSGPVSANYRGAFDPVGSPWVAGWTALSQGGIFVPEPGSTLLLMSGVLGLAVMPRRRRR